MPGQEAKYQKVIDWVKENIENGNFCPGDKLMSENELSEKFGLSRQTIRRATGELESQKVVTRLRGSGTYIGELPGLERTSHMNIAVVSTFTETYIFPSILKGIAGTLSEAGYATQVFFTDNRLSREAAILRQILQQDNVDGLIVEPVKSALPNVNIELYKEIRRRNIPVLFFNTFYPGLDIPCVRIDDAKAAQKATQLLLEAGHENIGAIFKSDDGQGLLRYTGYIQTMRQAGKKTGQDTILWLDTPAAQDMSGFAEYLFRRLEPCTAVICYNDQIAYQLINLAWDRGLKVPEDLSVVGIDDSYLAQACRTAFSSISHPKEQLGIQAAQSMLRMIQSSDYDGGVLMETEVIKRGSVKEL